MKESFQKSRLQFNARHVGVNMWKKILRTAQTKTLHFHLKVKHYVWQKTNTAHYPENTITFLQNNPTHPPRATKRWVRSKHDHASEWSSQNPDLNPAKNLR